MILLHSTFVSCPLEGQREVDMDVSWVLKVSGRYVMQRYGI